MGKRKLSPLVQAMAIYTSLDERDRVTLSDWIRTQPHDGRRDSLKSPTAPTAAKGSSTKKEKAATTRSDRTEKGGAGDVDHEAMERLGAATGATAKDCRIALTQSGGDEATALRLLTARGQVKGEGDATNSN